MQKPKNILEFKKAIENASIPFYNVCEKIKTKKRHIYHNFDILLILDIKVIQPT